MKKVEMFFDRVNRIFTDNSSYSPVYKGDIEGYFYETWSDSNRPDTCLTFSYSTDSLEDTYMSLDEVRDEYFKNFNYHPDILIRMTLPPSIYDTTYNYFCISER